MSAHNNSNFINQCKTNKHSSLRSHCFHLFNVAPSPGIALKLCVNPRAALCSQQMVDSFPQMSVEPGAEVRGSTPAAIPAPSSRPTQLPHQMIYPVPCPSSTVAGVRSSGLRSPTRSSLDHDAEKVWRVSTIAGIQISFLSTFNL